MLAGQALRPYPMAMTDDQLKAAIGNFMRHVGHSAQRELEKAVRAALTEGKLKRWEGLPASITVRSDQVGLEVTIHSRIEL